MPLHSFNLESFMEKTKSLFHVAKTKRYLFFYSLIKDRIEYIKRSFHLVFCLPPLSLPLSVAIGNPANPAFCTEVKRSFITVHLETV